ncbi:hypothetical protein ABTJ92_19020, partial [Acinetobacter baumannii]
ELLRPMIESAARELRVEQPERAAAVQDRGSAILLEREQALLTQQAIHRQAVMTLDLLIANQTVLDKAINWEFVAQNLDGKGTERADQEG